jgi:hypothetical protein
LSGHLARYLAERFSEERPRGWGVSREHVLFSPREVERLRFQARVDLLLHAPDGRRIAIELEVSRDDLVMNHAKVLVAYERKVLGPDDVFVSMMSPHISRGRRYLAAAFSGYMRSAGLPAFQVALLPMLAPLEVQRSNRDEARAWEVAMEHAKGELARVLAVVEPRGVGEHRIHFVGDVTDVFANGYTWNEEMKGPRAELWGRRAVQFFVADPEQGLFAPSKFCAFLPAQSGEGPSPPPTMTLEVYTSLGEQDPRFDGYRARQYLVKRLGFREVQRLEDLGALAARWEQWYQGMSRRVTLRKPLRWLVPPSAL